jgi:beta-ribofuranosylaminobenzene 5'-phosphate synthase
MTGYYFKRVQGGSYRTKETEEIIGFMRDNGAYGCGQSSWGPAVYGLTTRKEGRLLTRDTKRFLSEGKILGDVFYSGAREKGASIVCF